MKLVGLPLLWTFCMIAVYTRLLSLSSLPELTEVFDQSFLDIFVNFLSILKFVPFCFGPYLLSLLTLKKKEKNYYLFLALGLLVLRMFLNPPTLSEENDNLILNENQIILGKYCFPFPEVSASLTKHINRVYIVTHRPGRDHPAVPLRLQAVRQVDAPFNEPGLLPLRVLLLSPGLPPPRPRNRLVFHENPLSRERAHHPNRVLPSKPRPGFRVDSKGGHEKKAERLDRGTKHFHQLLLVLLGSTPNCGQGRRQAGRVFPKIREFVFGGHFRLGSLARRGDETGLFLSLLPRA